MITEKTGKAKTKFELVEDIEERLGIASTNLWRADWRTLKALSETLRRTTSVTEQSGQYLQAGQWIAGIFGPGDEPVTDEKTAEAIVQAAIGGHLVPGEKAEDEGMWLVTLPELVVDQLATFGYLNVEIQGPSGQPGARVEIEGGT